MALFALFLLSYMVLIAGSHIRNEGDGTEYMAMALQLSELNRPSLTLRDVRHHQRTLQEVGHGYENVGLGVPALQGRDRRFDFSHFWFYSLLAVPGIWLTKLADLNPQWAFVLLNLVLLSGATWVLLRSLRWPFVILLAAGPIVWWLDKAHTEIFTFALLTVAVVTMKTRPMISLILLGIASTQNPPIALAIGIFAVAMIWSARSLKLRKVWFGVAAGGLIASIHPIYYLTRLGVPTPTSRMESAGFRLPTLEEFSAVLGDLNLGLIPNYPSIVVVGLAMVVTWLMVEKKYPSSDVLPWLGIVAVVFLFAFSQTTNYNHGATQGMSRYTVWLTPLVIPLLVTTPAVWRKARLFVIPIALISSAYFFVKYHPDRGGENGYHTAVAEFVMKRAPGIYNPVPEIFFERTTHLEKAPEPVAFGDGCEKVLLVAAEWPSDCEPSGEVPDVCQGALALCYANKRSDGYDFVEGPSSCGMCGWHEWPSSSRM